MSTRPALYADDDATIGIQSKLFGGTYLYADGAPELLFCDNDSNLKRLYGVDGGQGYFKDGFHEYLIAGRQGCRQSRPPRHQGRRPLPARDPGPWRRDGPAASGPGHEHAPVRRFR